jgi:hypothetical protein
MIIFFCLAVRFFVIILLTKCTNQFGAMLLDVCKEQLEAFGDCAGKTMIVQVFNIYYCMYHFSFPYALFFKKPSLTF